MRKCMHFFFIGMLLVLVQLGAHEHCNIENADTPISQEYTHIISPKDLLSDHHGMFVNLDGMLFSVKALAMIGNQWFATVDSGRDAGYCLRGHNLCTNCGLCHLSKCPYYVEPC